MEGERTRELVTQYVAALENSLEEQGRIISDSVRKAFLTVERHRFLEGFYRWDEQRTYKVFNPEDSPYELFQEIYSLQPILIKISPPSTCSDPCLVARMLEFLKLEKGMHVLEIGGGTGYNAALMAEMVGKQGSITSLEIQPDLVEKTRRLLSAAGCGNVHIYHQDGFYGWTEQGPYDRIVVTTCSFDVSPYWFDQLREDGWMLIPLKHRFLAPLTQVFKDGKARLLSPAGFMFARGRLSDPGLWPEVDRAFLKAPETKEIPWPFPKRMKKELPWDFELFMGLWPEIDSNLVLSYSEEEGRRFIGKGEVDKLYKLLKLLYKEYVAVGFPKIKDYQTEFTLQSQSSSPSVKRIGPKEWVIEREHTSQRIWLSE